MRTTLAHIPWIIAVTMTAMMTISSSGRAATGAWEVLYGNRDLTNAAAPLPMGDTVLVNATNIGPILGISVFPEGTGVLIRGADGRNWRWEPGDSSLYSDGHVIPLSCPAIQQGLSLFLEAEAIAELSRLAVAVDAPSKRVLFHRPDFIGSLPTARDGIGDGWQPFTIAKAQPLKPEGQRDPARMHAIPNPPPPRDRLDVGLGLGYVEDIDWGMQLTASGKVWGGTTNLWALFTSGNEGSKLHSTHFTWLDREGGTGVEAGDLYSEIWGLVRGFRYSWNARGSRWSSLGLYLKTDRTQNRETAVAYRDGFRVSRNLRVQGEVGTDESSYATAEYDKDPLQVFGFHRHLPDNQGTDKGLFGSLAISRGVSLFYGTHSTTDSRAEESTCQTVGLRLPLLKQCNLALEQTEYKRGYGSLTTRSAGLTVPLANSVNLLIRYQENSSDRDAFSGHLLALHTNASSLLTSLSLFASPRVRLNYYRHRYAYGGQTFYYEQLLTNYRLSSRTTLQAISGFPNITDTDLLRLRLEHQWADGMSLLLDYGRLAPYQSVKDVFGKRGYMIMLRKTWPTWVPARGGKVSGRVLDQLGQPVNSITVRLGPYTAVSDKRGQYSFEAVPSGTYPIAIASESVPADYKVTTEKQELKVNRDSRHDVTLSLIPLGCITGRVYVDRDNNGRYDPGEEVRNVAVCVDNRATATGKEGRFAFYNLDPGHYAVRIAVEVLDKRYAPKGVSQLEVELRPQESITDVEFRLQERKKPILFVDIG